MKTLAEPVALEQKTESHRSRMSWIRTTYYFTLASLLWLASAHAQTPQLAPPQYGPNDGARGLNDLGPQPNLAPQPANDDSRDYLRLLNPPAATTASTPTTANTAAANPSQTNPPATVPLNNGQLNVAARSEPTNPSPNVQAVYQQPITGPGTPAATTLNPPAPKNTPNVAPGNAPVAYHAPANLEPTQNEALKNEPLKNDASNPPRPLNANGAKPLPLAGPNTKSPGTSSSWSSFGTMLGSLAIVLGLFVVTIKLLRRGMPGAKQKLGRDVVEVLGQTPLAPRQTLQVIRFGNKILLVAMSPDGCDTLTEITDPLEVDRLAGMCQQSQANSSTKSFGDMFRQVTSIRPVVTEPTDEPATASTLDDVRARLRGGSLTNREVTHG